jgi:hypothetical protein
MVGAFWKLLPLPWLASPNESKRAAGRARRNAPHRTADQWAACRVRLDGGLRWHRAYRRSSEECATLPLRRLPQQAFLRWHARTLAAERHSTSRALGDPPAPAGVRAWDGDKDEQFESAKSPRFRAIKS